MPKDNFVPIVTNSYILSKDLLIVAKSTISKGKSGDKIFEECGVSATIVETLPVAMHMIGGVLTACFVYKLCAVKLTDEELAEQKRIDEQQRIIQDKLDMKEALQNVDNAPPPIKVLVSVDKCFVCGCVIDKGGYKGSSMCRKCAEGEE